MLPEIWVANYLLTILFILVFVIMAPVLTCLGGVGIHFALKRVFVQKWIAAAFGGMFTFLTLGLILDWCLTILRQFPNDALGPWYFGWATIGAAAGIVARHIRNESLPLREKP